MSLFRDIGDSFKAKGMEYVSIEELQKDRNKTLLTYKDSSGKILTREIPIPLDELKNEMAEVVDVIDPDGLADFLLGNDTSGDAATPG